MLFHTISALMRADEWEWDDGDDEGGNDNDANVLRDGDDIRELLKECIAM